MPGSIDFVFLDIGGVLYDDRVYAEAWRRALREAGGRFTDEGFDREYAACRAAQDGSFRRRLADRFIGSEADPARLERLASRHWHYPPSALHDDVLPALEVLRDAGFRLGVIANQPTQVRAALERDGLVPFFEAPALPTPEQLAEPDAAIGDLRELPEVIGALAGT
jgi:FMN phosphatase YigB (HAD superfamily)